MSHIFIPRADEALKRNEDYINAAYRKGSRIHSFAMRRLSHLKQLEQQADSCVSQSDDIESEDKK